MRNFVSPHSDRIAKLSEKLGSLQSSISSDRTGRIDSVETKLGMIEENYLEQHDAISKKYTSLKEEITNIKAAIDEERSARERYINDKMNDVRALEDSFMERMETEAAARKDMENRLARQVEDRASSLRSDLMRDFKLSLGELERVHDDVAGRLAPLEDSVHESRGQLEDFETKFKNQLGEHVDRMASQVQVEKSSREETEEALLQMLKDVVGHIKADLEAERKDRESTEETLLNLLEDTCSKLTQV